VVGANQTKSALAECQQLAGSILGAFEGALLNESLPQKIAKVILHLVTLSAVSVIGEVLSGDDAELAEVNERADFGIAETIAAIAVIDETTCALAMNVRMRLLFEAPMVSRRICGGRAVYGAFDVTVECKFAFGLDGIEEVLSFAQWIEARHL
jgi:hypothetical protein